MAIAGLNKTNGFLVDDALDSIVIMNDAGDIPGGKTLDVSGFSEEYIKSGHIVVVNTKTKEYSPLGVTGNAYKALTADEKAVGVVKKTITKAQPFAAILVAGQINKSACPFPVTDALVTALPSINFL